MKKGLLITFEGGEGTGKSTISNMIYNELIGKGLDCIITREPGGVTISEQIRKVILDKDNIMDDKTEALLYAASRREHLVRKIIPALEENKIVICDRYIDSSLAYQGHARGIGIDQIFRINKFAIENYLPDLSLVFDLDPKIGLERISKNSEREVNRLDLEKIEFHNKVREGYNLLIDEYNNTMVRIDASQRIENVFSQCINAINDLFWENGLK